jgi:hypothetical protein
MKLQRTFIYIAGVFFAVGFAASQAAAGTGIPGCSDGPIGGIQIEVNQLRAGGKTIVTSPGDTTKVTSKARILKGTAPSGTTIDSTLTIEIRDGEGGPLVGSDSTAEGAITLGVGKGGKGASLNISTEECASGSLFITATFHSLDEDNDPCVGEETIRKDCR